MLAIGLSLISALAYGVGDFLGGIFTKSASAWRVATTGQFTSMVISTAAAIFVSGNATGADIRWSMCAGLGSGIGAAFLYRGLANGQMNVVAPISAVTCALLPVGVGIATGDRPSWLAAAGIVLAFPAIWLISKVIEEGASDRGGITDGFVSGIGFGVMLAALAQVGPTAGLWPISALYVTSFTAVGIVALSLGHHVLPKKRSDLWPLTLGLLGAPSAIAFYYASNHGMLSIVSVVTSLYPATTVLLAALFLRERIRGHQSVGLGLAAAAVACVALG